MSLSIERSLCVNEIGRHVFGVVFSVPPSISLTGSKHQISFLFPPATPSIYCYRINHEIESCVPTHISSLW